MKNAILHCEEAHDLRELIEQFALADAILIRQHADAEASVDLTNIDRWEVLWHRWIEEIEARGGLLEFNSLRLLYSTDDERHRIKEIVHRLKHEDRCA